MTRRLVAMLTLLALMGAFAFGVNRFLASRRANIPSDTTVSVPTATRPTLVLPGTLFLAQHGDIYRLSGGYFTDLHMPRLGMWLQPAAIPGSQTLLAVLRTDAYSEVYMLNADGSGLHQLTHNATTSKTIQFNHWMFWPRVASDGQTVYVSYDAPKDSNSYEIEFAVWKGLLSGKFAASQMTVPFGYTGGDVAPISLPNGNILYSKYEIASGQVFSRLALQTKALNEPVYLTDPEPDCGQPAVTADASWVAMVCTGGTGLQSTRLEIAPLLGTRIGTPRVLVDNCLCSAPAWAPDGSGLAYYAPADASGHFQLWWIAGANAPAPHAPQQVTNNLDFDATSPPAWSPFTIAPAR